MGTETVERSDLAEAIAERDRILIAFDVEAAKAFVVAHGGTAPKNITWETVLHLARHECESIKKTHPDPWMDSKIYLARNGTYGVARMPPNSPYVRTALNLIFPKRLFEAHLARAIQDRADGDADTAPEPYHNADYDSGCGKGRVRQPVQRRGLMIAPGPAVNPNWVRPDRAVSAARHMWEVR